jgi:hypothetical protein
MCTYVFQAIVVPLAAPVAIGTRFACYGESEHAEGDDEVSDLHSGWSSKVRGECRSLLAQFEESVGCGKEDRFLVVFVLNAGSNA